MTGKLVKYDLLANLKKFMIVYVSFLGAALLLLISVWFGVISTSVNSQLISVLLAFGIVLMYALALLAVNVLGLVFIGLRFRDCHIGCMRDHYMTVPASAEQRLGASVASGVIWLVISYLVVNVSSMPVMYMLVDYLQYVGASFGDVISITVSGLPSGIAAAIAYAVYTAASLACNINVLYLAICIGYSTRSSHIFISVAVYIGIEIAISLVGSILSIPISSIIYGAGLSAYYDIIWYIAAAAMFAAASAVLFLLTRNLLRNTYS